MSFSESFKDGWDLAGEIGAWWDSKDFEDEEDPTATTSDVGTYKGQTESLGLQAGTDYARMLEEQNAGFGAEGSNSTAEALNSVDAWKNKSDAAVQDKWSYRGEQFDAEPTRYQRRYAESMQRAKNYDKWGLKDDANAARKEADASIAAGNTAALTQAQTDNTLATAAKTKQDAEFKNQDRARDIERQQSDIEQIKEQTRGLQSDNRVKEWTEALTVAKADLEFRTQAAKSPIEVQILQSEQKIQDMAARSAELDFQQKTELLNLGKGISSLAAGNFDQINKPEFQNAMGHIARVYNNPEVSDDNNRLVKTDKGWVVEGADGSQADAASYLKEMYSQNPTEFGEVLKQGQMYALGAMQNDWSKVNLEKYRAGSLANGSPKGLSPEDKAKQLILKGQRVTANQVLLAGITDDMAEAEAIAAKSQSAALARSNSGKPTAPLTGGNPDRQPAGLRSPEQYKTDNLARTSAELQARDAERLVASIQFAEDPRQAYEMLTNPETERFLKSVGLYEEAKKEYEALMNQGSQWNPLNNNSFLPIQRRRVGLGGN